MCGELLTAEQRSVEAEALWQLLDVCDPLAGRSAKMLCVVQAAQNDAGEIERLSEETQ